MTFAVFTAVPVLCLTFGGLAATASAQAEVLSSRTRAAVVAGLTDYHGERFPDVVEPPSVPPSAGPADGNTVELPAVKVNTTRLPLSRLLVVPETRNVVERWLPGTGVTVTRTKSGAEKTVGRLFFIPVYWHLNW